MKVNLTLCNADRTIAPSRVYMERKHIVWTNTINPDLRFVYTARFGFSILDTDDEKRMMTRRELNDVILPKHFAFIESFLKESETGWIANTCRPSPADFQLVGCMKFLTCGTHEGISTEILKPFPLITDWMERFYALPAIKAYYDSKK